MSFTTRLVWVALVMLALLLAGCGSLTGSNQIEELETQNAQLQGTIQVIGTPVLTIAALEQAATQNVVFQAQLTESAVNLLEAESTLTVFELGGSTAGAASAASNPRVATAPAAPPGDQPAAIPTPSPSPASAANAGTTFTGTVITTSLDEFDCPVTTAARLENTTQRIYVDTRINLLPAGSQISARWYVNGELFFDDVQCWIPDTDWQDICAYCSIEPDGATFPTGTWTVELYLDGELMSQTGFETFDPAAETGLDEDAGGGAAQ